MTGEDKLSRYTRRGAPDDCWPWIGGKHRHGYGGVYVGKRHVKAHRLAWEVANQTSVPSGMFVCHRCDNPSCVNPSHLFIGTAAENNADKAKKGRAPQFFGTANPAARLTDEQVSAILADARQQRDIARAYGISQGSVSRIKNGKRRSFGSKVQRGIRLSGPEYADR